MALCFGSGQLFNLSGLQDLGTCPPPPLSVPFPPSSFIPDSVPGPCIARRGLRQGMWAAGGCRIGRGMEVGWWSRAGSRPRCLRPLLRGCPQP